MKRTPARLSTMTTSTKTLLYTLSILAIPALVTAAVTLHPGGNDDATLKIYGLTQIELRGGDAYSDGGGAFFQAQRVRLGTTYFHGPWTSKLFLDFSRFHSDTDAILPNMLKDAFIGYRYSDAAFIRVGMSKTPIGMSYTSSGTELDNIERNGLEKGLQLERSLGITINGRQIGGRDDPQAINGTEVGHEKQSGYGFGYDLGFYNAAGRSEAVIWDATQTGSANAYAGRLHYDHGWPFHAEVGYGLSEDAGGAGTEDYMVLDVGIDSNPLDRKATLKLEYVKGENIQGEAGWDQSCAVGTVGYLVHPNAEFVVKHYAGKSEKASIETTLQNTYIGMNLFIGPLGNNPSSRQAHRVQINYVVVGGDDGDATVPFNGLAGLTCNGWVVQWQRIF
jgi:hypothetical protein